MGQDAVSQARNTVPLRAAGQDDGQAVLAALVEASLDCIKLVERDGTLIYMTRNGRCAMQIDDADQVLGRLWSAMWPPPVRPRLLEAFAEALGGHADRFQAWCPTFKGNLRYWDVTVSPVFGADGTVERVLSVSRDMTDLHLGAGVGGCGATLEAGGVAAIEHRRLEALRELGILDSEPDPILDETTQAAAGFFGVQTALVSLVDERRQWFASRTNFEVRETGRDVAFCDYAIRRPADVLVVEDAKADPRFSENPLVTKPGGIRFYAGAPLLTSAGVAIGTLCLIDDRPRRFTAREAKALSLFAANAMTRIEVLQQGRALDDRDVAIREMKHRVSNTYAQVASLVRLLAKTADDKDELTKRLTERIAMLSRAQAHILASDYEAGDAEGLIRQVLGDEPRVRTAIGRPVVLNDQGTFLLALLLGELATNARKYGALSDEAGTIEIAVEADERFVLRWTERAASIPAGDGGPVPEGRGFGTRILTDLVPRSLQGRSTLVRTDGELAYVFEAPTERLERA